MRYKAFGSTGLQISELSLGTWGIGGAGWDSYSQEVRLEAITSAIEEGINIIDTAPAYNTGRAEQLVGEAVKKLGCRNKIYLTTKCGTEFHNGSYVRSCAGDTILRECEESLRNLKTDYIDFYLIHWPDSHVPIEETMSALNRLKAEGKIRHIGVSNFSRAQIEEAQKYGPVEIFQKQYSMVNRDCEEDLRWACAQGMGTMTYGSLGAGILSGKIRELKNYAENDSRSRFYKFFQEPVFSQIMKLLNVMDAIAGQHAGTSLAQIALNWATQKPFVSTSIVGAQTRDKILENCAAFSWELTLQEMETLDQAIAQLLPSIQ